MQPVAWPFTLLAASTIANQRIGSISVDQDELHVLCVSSSGGDGSTSGGSASGYFSGSIGGDGNIGGVEARVSADTPRPTLTVVGQTLRMESDGSVRHVDNFQHYLDVSSLVGNNPGRICCIAPDSLKRERERLPRRVVYTAEASNGSNGGSGASKSAAATNAMNLGLAQMNATVRLVSRTQLTARVTVTVVSSAGAPMPAPSMLTTRSGGSNNNSTSVSSASASEKALFECVWDVAGPSPMAYENGLRRINLTAFGSKRLQRGTTTLQVVAGRNWSDRRFLLANQLAPMGRDLHLSGTVFTLSALATANASSSASAPPPPPSTAPSSPASVAAKAAADVAAANHVLNTNSLRIHAGAPSTALSAAVASAANNAASIAAAAAAASSNAKNLPLRGSVALAAPRSPYSNGSTAQCAFFEGTAPLSFDRFSDANLTLSAANSPLAPSSSSSSFSNGAAVVVSGSVSATRTLQVVRVWYDAEYPDCVVVLTRAAASSALELCVSAIDRDHTFFPAANASPVVSLAAMSTGGNSSQNNAASANASAFGGASAAGSAVVQKIDIQRFFASDSMLQANDLCDENSRAFIVGEQTGVVGHNSSIKRVVLCFSTRSSSSSTTASDARIASGGSAGTPLSSSHLRPQRFALIRAERNSLCSSFPAVFTSSRALSYALLRRSDLVAVASPLEECVTLVDSIFPRVVLKCSVRQLVRCLGSGPCPANAAAVENVSLRTWSCSGGGAWDLRHERLVVFWNSPTQRLPRYSSPYNANSNSHSTGGGGATAASSGLSFPSAPPPQRGGAATAGKPPLRWQSSMSLDNGSDVMPPLQGSPSSRVGGGGCDETMTNASSVPRQQLQRAPSGTFCVLDLSADELVSSVRSLLLPTLQTRLAARSAAHMLYITPRLPRNKNSSSGAGGGGGGLGAVAPAAGSALPLARVGDLVAAFRAGTALSRWGATALSGWIDAEIRSRYDSAPLRSVTEDHPIVLLPLSQLVSMIIYSQHSAALRDQQRQRELEVQQERLVFLQRQQYNNQLHPGSLLSPTQPPLGAGAGAGQQQQQPLVMTDELLQRLRHEERLEHAAGRSIPLFRDPASAAVAAAATSGGGGGGDTGLRDEAQRYAQRLLKQQQKRDKAAKAASPTAPTAAAAVAVKPRPQPKPEPTPEHLRPQEQQQFPSAPVSPTLEEFETSKFVLEVLEAMRLVWARLVGPLMEEHNAEKRKAAAATVNNNSSASTWSPAHAAELLHLANIFSEACELSALGLDGGFGSELALDVAGEVRALLSALIYDNRRALRSVLPLPAIARMHVLFGASSSAATARAELNKQIQAHHGSARVFGLRQERADAAWAAATPARMNRQRRQQEQQSPSERRVLPHSPPPRVSAFADRARERRAAISGGNMTAAAFVRLH